MKNVIKLSDHIIMVNKNNACMIINFYSNPSLLISSTIKATITNW